MPDKKEITMYDYILEEQSVLNDLLRSKDKITNEFESFMKDNAIEEVVISGSGTSYHSALAVRRFWESVLKIRVRAEYPMMLKDTQDFYSDKTLLVAISQGGQSQSTLDIIDKAKERHIPVAAISENKNAAIFEKADLKILMEIGPELSVAKTKGYVGTITILFLMGLAAAKSIGNITEAEYDEYFTRLETVINNYSVIVPEATQWVESIRPELVAARRIIVVGYKNHYANVLEGALKLLETLRYGVSGYEIEEFFHGIYNSIDEKTYIFYLASEGIYRNKVKTLKSVLDENTKHQFVISKGIDGYVPTEKDCILPFVDDEVFSVLEYILPLQIISAIIPYDLGINPFLPSDPDFHRKVKSKLV